MGGLAGLFGAIGEAGAAGAGAETAGAAAAAGSSTGMASGLGQAAASGLANSAMQQTAAQALQRQTLGQALIQNPGVREMSNSVGDAIKQKLVSANPIANFVQQYRLKTATGVQSPIRDMLAQRFGMSGGSARMPQSDNTQQLIQALLQAVMNGGGGYGSA